MPITSIGPSKDSYITTDDTSPYSTWAKGIDAATVWSTEKSGSLNSAIQDIVDLQTKADELIKKNAMLEALVNNLTTRCSESEQKISQLCSMVNKLQKMLQTSK